MRKVIRFLLAAFAAALIVGCIVIAFALSAAAFAFFGPEVVGWTAVGGLFVLFTILLCGDDED